MEEPGSRVFALDLRHPRRDRLAAPWPAGHGVRFRHVDPWFQEHECTRVGFVRQLRERVGADIDRLTPREEMSLLVHDGDVRSEVDGLGGPGRRTRRSSGT